jgi:phage shock protein PspC (stress-responsive transcriptional regulator)
MSDDLNGAASPSEAPAGAGDPSGGPGGPSGKKLERKIDGRWLAGVCIGLADYTGIDVSLIRVIFAVLTLFGGVGPIAYLIAWALVPEEGESTSIAEKFINKGQ